MTEETGVLGAFGQLAPLTLAKWGVLAGLACLLAYRMHRVDRQVYRALPESGAAAASMHRLWQTARQRGKIVLGLWLLLSVLIAYRDVEQFYGCASQYPGTPRTAQAIPLLEQLGPAGQRRTLQSRQTPFRGSGESGESGEEAR